MKIEAFFLNLIFLVITNILFAQVRHANGTTLGNAPNSSAFFDASSVSSWNGSTNLGKGMIFPRVQLDQFTNFSLSGPTGISNNYPTRFDGFVVYNTTVGGTAGVGATDGTLTYGFWYYDNPSTTLNGGTWRPINTGAQGPAGFLPNGSIAGNTPFWNGTEWVVNNTNLINNGVSVGIGITNPDPSAKVDISSTTQGFLPPRMTSAQRDAIVNPANGLTVFNTTTGCINYFFSNAWRESCGSIVLPAGTVVALNCANANRSGTLIQGQVSTGASLSIPYTGGNGGTHNGQLVNSTGVTGLTATLSAGNFSSGNGTLAYSISGTPNAIGNASFVINIGGQTCTVTFPVVASPLQLYPSGSVFCAAGPTVVVEVTNPTTGKIWMDRNLGASNVASSSTDVNSYGDLYQWGRGSDGHQCRNSTTTTNLSSTSQPGNGSFINTLVVPFDWLSPANSNLWQGVNGLNNPCPNGFRLPTYAELDAERLSWSTSNASGAFASPLKLPMSGYRLFVNGALDLVGFGGSYWSSTPDFQGGEGLFYNGNSGVMNAFSRADGLSVRCIKQ